jgi:hypothetical protein
MMAKAKTAPYQYKRLSIMDLMSMFNAPRNDHPGRKSGCPHRRGCFNGKVTRTRK